MNRVLPFGGKNVPALYAHIQVRMSLARISAFTLEWAQSHKAVPLRPVGEQSKQSGVTHDPCSLWPSGFSLGGISCWHFRISIRNGYFMFVSSSCIVSSTATEHLNLAVLGSWKSTFSSQCSFFLKPACSSVSPLYPITKYSNRRVILKCSTPPTVHSEIELIPSLNFLSHFSLFPHDSAVLRPVDFLPACPITYLASLSSLSSFSNLLSAMARSHSSRADFDIFLLRNHL